ncbi:hypothetical protein QTP70_021835 [Hemibagrus guttatus]|uniref:Uncharacterized protein n=1 Tax=Hemibagrus guttatus TaxID=175788 RepID=A0AAE0UHE0_9TELE|nr:hypothetical protein QTP70_021835 [Hemibagrus guttatus]
MERRARKRKGSFINGPQKKRGRKNYAGFQDGSRIKAKKRNFKKDKRKFLPLSCPAVFCTTLWPSYGQPIQSHPYNRREIKIRAREKTGQTSTSPGFPPPAPCFL